MCDVYAPASYVRRAKQNGHALSNEKSRINRRRHRVHTADQHRHRRRSDFQCSKYTCAPPDETCVHTNAFEVNFGEGVVAGGKKWVRNDHQRIVTESGNLFEYFKFFEKKLYAENETAWVRADCEEACVCQCLSTDGCVAFDYSYVLPRLANLAPFLLH